MGEGEKSSNGGMTRRGFLERLGKFTTGVVVSRIPVGILPGDSAKMRVDDGGGNRPPVDETMVASEVERWKEDRFFESIEEFAGRPDWQGQIEAMERDLEAVGDNLGKCFESVGFEGGKWTNTSQAVVGCLRRMVEGYIKVMTPGKFDVEAREFMGEFANEQFRNLGPAIWLALRVGEEYGDDPDKLKLLVQEYASGEFVNSVDGGDALLGKEADDLLVAWNGEESKFGGRRSAAIELFAGYRSVDNQDEILGQSTETNEQEWLGLARVVSRFGSGFGLEVGKANLPDFRPSWDRKRREVRPQRAGFQECCYQDQVAEVVEKLGEDNLDRVMGTIITSPGWDASGEYDPLTRELWASYPEVEGEDGVLGPDKVAVEQILRHEAHHGLWFNGEYLRDGAEVLELVWLQEQVLRELRPYGNVKKAVANMDYSPPEDGVDLQVTSESLTRYGGDCFLGIPLPGELNLFGQDNWSGVVVEWLDRVAGRGDEGLEDGLIDRMGKKKMGDGKYSLESWWREAWPQIEAMDLDGMDELVLVEINGRLEEMFEQGVVTSEKYGANWLTSLTGVLIPTVVAGWITDEPEEVTRWIDSNGQRVEWERLRLEYKRHERNNGDVELFAEVMAVATMSTEAGFEFEKDKLPEGFDVDKLRRLERRMVEILIDNGLAMEPNETSGNRQRDTV